MAAGPAPVTQEAVPAGAIQAAMEAYNASIGASMPAPQGQRWIPGLPSTDAAFRVQSDPKTEREMAYWRRAGNKAFRQQELAEIAARGHRGFGSVVEQLGMPGWPSEFTS